MNLKQFDVLIDNKLSMIRLYLLLFFFFLAYFLLKRKDDQYKIVAFLDSSILIEKKSTESRSKYL